MLKTIIPLILILFTGVFAQSDYAQLQKLVASDRDSNDRFANSVSISGDYAIVGAKMETGDVSGLNVLATAGSAYIFKRSGVTWTQIKKIVASDRAVNDAFGDRVSISGNYAVVSAPWEDENASGGGTVTNAGSVYVFYKDQGGIDNWGQMKKIVASDRAIGDWFGSSISILGDYLIVGAYLEDDDAYGLNAASSAGSAYIFSKDQGGVNNWGQVKKIVASDRAASDYFGYSVSISGNFVVVGAYFESHDASGLNTASNAGSAYIFSKDQGGVSNWGQVKKLVALDRFANDNFGYSVSISGNYAIVGAYRESHDTSGLNPASSAGSAYIFSKDQGGVNNWGQVKKIVASDRAASDYFGYSVSISGNYAIVGAYAECEDASGLNNALWAGSAYIFYKEAVASNSWRQIKKIVASDRGREDYFGNCVSIYNNYAIIGAPNESEDAAGGNTALNSGSAYVFASTYASPTIQASNITFSNIQPTQMAINWTNGDGGKRVVFVKQAVMDTLFLLDGTTASANSTYGSGFLVTTGWYCVYNGTGTSVMISGLTAGKNYIAQILEYNGSNGAERYLPTIENNNPSAQATEAAQATNITIYTNHGPTELGVTWVRGNGSGVAVFAAQTSTGAAAPVDGTAYVAHPNFGTGTQIGSSGWYCIYNGTDTYATPMALIGGTTYRFMAIEYNYIGALINYSNMIGTGNPANGSPPRIYQIITFALNADSIKTYGNSSFSLTGISSSGLSVTYSSSNIAVATITGSTVTIIGAGTTTITAHQTGNSSYFAANNVSRTLTVNAKGLTITGVIGSNKTYDGTTAATLSGGSLVGVVGSDIVTLALGTGTFADKNVGTGKAITTTGYS